MGSHRRCLAVCVSPLRKNEFIVFLWLLWVFYVCMMKWCQLVDICSFMCETLHLYILSTMLVKPKCLYNCVLSIVLIPLEWRCKLQRGSDRVNANFSPHPKMSDFLLRKSFFWVWGTITKFPWWNVSTTCPSGLNKYYRKLARHSRFDPRCNINKPSISHIFFPPSRPNKIANLLIEFCLPCMYNIPWI